MRKCLLLSASSLLSATVWAAAVTPVVLIPGFGGSVLQAQLNRSSVVAAQCALQAPAYTIWVNQSQFAADQLPCFVDNMRLNIDNTTLRFSSMAGVTVQPLAGSTLAVQLSDPTDNTTNYMELLIEYFEKQPGYVRGQNIVAAPYDWRFMPFINPSDPYFANLKALIESTSASQSAKVCILTHSMGALVALKFLNLQTPDWKAKHVACWISASGAFGGATMKTKTMVSGDNTGINAINGTLFRDALRTFESNIILQPTPTVFGSSAVLIQTPTVNYTYAQIAQLLIDLGLNTQASAYNSYVIAKESLTAPGVPLHCFQGNGVTCLS
eukprot:TRINITY_DN5975_c0_g1_i3.p1 TRINITY_DN5975_c0_g1~~TRINITY_DN5975_c0_g1_i3.p1  ORF type:complete len:326 (-),score=63.11 TRINITY_DN5975_c0_g1_i3:602-1579(-)